MPEQEYKQQPMKLYTYKSKYLAKIKNISNTQIAHSTYITITVVFVVFLSVPT